MDEDLVCRELCSSIFELVIQGPNFWSININENFVSFETFPIRYSFAEDVCWFSYSLYGFRPETNLHINMT